MDIRSPFSVRLSPVIRIRVELWASRAGLTVGEFIRLVLATYAIEQAKQLGVFREDDLNGDKGLDVDKNF